MAWQGMREDERNREMTFIVKALGDVGRVSLRFLEMLLHPPLP